MAKAFIFIALSLCVLGTTAGRASETVTYKYDAKGRLIRVDHSGTANNGVSAQYAYDRANSRSNAKVIGVPMGTLTSSSPTNTCTLNAQGVCTLTISWAVSSGSPSTISVKVGSPEQIFTTGVRAGSQDAPWIQASGATFKLYADTTVIATLNVRGVN